MVLRDIDGSIEVISFDMFSDWYISKTMIHIDGALPSYLKQAKEYENHLLFCFSRQRTKKMKDHKANDNFDNFIKYENLLYRSPETWCNFIDEISLEFGFGVSVDDPVSQTCSTGIGLSLTFAGIGSKLHKAKTPYENSFAENQADLHL